MEVMAREDRPCIFTMELMLLKDRTITVHDRHQARAAYKAHQNPMIRGRTHSGIIYIPVLSIPISPPYQVTDLSVGGALGRQPARPPNSELLSVRLQDHSVTAEPQGSPAGRAIQIARRSSISSSEANRSRSRIASPSTNKFWCCGKSPANIWRRLWERRLHSR